MENFSRYLKWVGLVELSQHTSPKIVEGNHIHAEVQETRMDIHGCQEPPPLRLASEEVRRLPSDVVQVPWLGANHRVRLEGGQLPVRYPHCQDEHDGVDRNRHRDELDGVVLFAQTGREVGIAKVEAPFFFLRLPILRFPL